MVDNERIARRALEIAEELRKALPPNTDFADGWQQRYLDRQNERFDRALEQARAEAAGGEQTTVRYDGLYEYAQQNRLDYNDLCRVVRAASGVLVDAAPSGLDREQLRRIALELEELNLKLHGTEHNSYRPGIVCAAALMRAVAGVLAAETQQEKP